MRNRFPTMRFRHVSFIVAPCLAAAALFHADAQGLADEFRAAFDALAGADSSAQLKEQLAQEKARVTEALKSTDDNAARASLQARLRAVETALRLAGVSDTVEPQFSDDALHFFESKVRPVLIEHCQSCHGPEKQKSNLRLDSRNAILNGGDHGAGIVPGDAAASLLVRAIGYEQELKMPPSSKLDQAAIDALTEWVAMGAPWPKESQTIPVAAAAGIDIAKEREWWAFKPVVRSGPPAVKDESWIKTPVDRFILAKLEAEGIAPAGPADKRTLIRRATFDLVGLPPTPDEVDAFLADKSPNAFSKVIERLLASPHYGERWGRHWLDVVRYTDSFDSRAGTVTDPVNSWRYRDWVIGAFNSDMPYNEFVKYQIAGDLLPDPKQPDSGFNRDGTIATAMLAIGNWPQGDADKQKMVTDIVDDQIDVVTRGIMGVTMGCARCHDHKFDPFTMHDYYGLAGIFFSTHILPGPGQKTEGSPILHIPLITPEVAATQDARAKRDGELTAAINEQSAALRQRVVPQLMAQTKDYLIAAWDAAQARKSDPNFDTLAFAAQRGLNSDALTRWMDLAGLSLLRYLKNPVPNAQNLPGLFSWLGTNGMPSVTINTTDQERVYATIKQPPRSVIVHPSPTTGVAVAWRSPIAGEVTVSASIADADANCGNGVAWRIEHRAGTATATVAEGAMDNAGAADISPAMQPVPVALGDTLLFAIEPRGEYSCDSTVIKIQVTSVADAEKTWRFTPDLMADPLRSNPHPDSMGNADTWAFVDLGTPPAPSDSPLAAWMAASNAGDRAAVESASAQVQQVVDSVVSALAANGNDAAKLPDEANARFYKSLVAEQGPYFIDPLTLTAQEFAEDREKLAAVRKELDDLRAQPAPEIDYTEGAQEGGTPNTEHEGIRDARIHKRGSYTQLGDVVPRDFPAVLVRAGASAPQITGSGRKQLADWVGSAENPLTARVMVNRIWQHHFGEGIVRTPGNFGKLGIAPSHPELLDYLAAEFVSSGWSIKAMHRMMMLSSTYQQSCVPSAPGTDADNKFFGRQNRRRLEAEPLRDAMLAVSGKLDMTVGGTAFPDIATPRRTVYFRTVRSDRTSYTMLFDAADPTAIIDKRTESTVAPQALFLINNPFVLEQARAMAGRVLTWQATDDAARIAALYPILYARPPREEETAIGLRVLEHARAAAPNDETRAWQEYCQILLCANEFAFVD
ncbi:MAG: DUF1549 domain-containing protein [Candidatus Hydrogenedentes bacterium]|nr:DUF1549 domain-containing protein [Candidatus Hydrogenedentota bacterium]